MNAFEAAKHLATCLDEDRLPYAVGGALALGTWGAPRGTKDVDITVFVAERELPRVFDSLERAGVLLDRASAIKEVARIGLFKGRLGRIFVDVFLSGHPQYVDMERRRRVVTDSAGGKLVYISPEDLFIHKIVFGRAKDVVDLERLLAVRPAMEIDYIRSWLARMIEPGDARLTTFEDLVRRFAKHS